MKNSIVLASSSVSGLLTGLHTGGRRTWSTSSGQGRAATPQPHPLGVPAQRRQQDAAGGVRAALPQHQVGGEVAGRSTPR